MKAAAYPVEKIFDTAIHYRVPLYQRPYVWALNIEVPSEDRLTPFWEDVRDTVRRFLKRQEHIAQGVQESHLAAFADHFFGAVVLGKPSKAFGGIPHQEVIDGQQRFTTAQLLIVAAHRVAEHHGYHGTANALRDLYVNADKHDPSPEERYKLYPTNANRAAFAAVVDSAAATPDDPGNKIQEAYAFFAIQLAEWLDDFHPAERERHLKALHRVVRTHLKFVVIELEEGDNAQEIFESLNAQGTPLLAIDLVKNHVFRRADDAGLDLDKLNREQWRQIDDRWWRSEQRQGRFKRPRAELFLMHWLTLKKQDEVPALALFVEFQQLSTKESVPDQEIDDFVTAFVADAMVYRGFFDQPDGTMPRRFFDRLRLLDTTTLYPIALRLFIEAGEDPMLIQSRDSALLALESWLVRRMICGYTAKNYNRISVDLLKLIESSGGPAHTAIIRFLQEANVETEIWPRDAEVIDALRVQGLYNRLKPVRRVRLLLEACELEMRLKSGGYAEMRKQAAPQLGMHLTVEHVLPQKWKAYWPVTRVTEDGETLPPERVDELEAERSRRVHLLGNLTLATKKLNPSVSNGAWEKKWVAFDKHSILHLNREVIAHDAWDEKAIDARGLELASLITQHWRGPEAWALGEQ